MTSMNATWQPRWAGLRGALRRRHGHAAFAAHGPHDGPHHEDPRSGHRHGPGGRRGRPQGRFGAELEGFDAGFGGFPGGFRGRRGHRGRRSRGDVRLAVLALLAEQPRHGYEIIQEITDRTSGSWRASPGSVYPTIQQLEDEGLVRTEESQGRRTVHLTEAGREYVEQHRDELDRVWVSNAQDDETINNLRTQYGLLHAAVFQIVEAGTDAQRVAATEALVEARKTIYRLLAED